MKHGKKLLALALALCMAFALAVPAFAADGDPTPPKTLPTPPAATTNTEASLNGHTFELNQIFSGKFETLDGATVLTGIKWGSGFGATGTDTEKEAKAKQIEDFLEALKTEKLFGEGMNNAFYSIQYDPINPNRSADAVARVVATWNDVNGTEEHEPDTEYGDSRVRKFAELAKNFAESNPKSVTYDQAVTLDAGYYLIKDRTKFEEDSKDNVFNMNVIWMTGSTNNFKPKTKADVPELDKTVLEVNDSVADSTEKGKENPKWDDVADYDVGDTVWFTLTGTMPTDYDEYEKYEYIFHDTLSEHLKFNPGSVKVYVTTRGTAADVTKPIPAENYTVVTEGIGAESLQVRFTDLKALKDAAGEKIVIDKDSVIQVLYSATLQEGAKVEETNKAHLEFSNNPNPGGEGDKGTTPDDIVTVFNFKLIVNKTSDKLQEGSTTEYEPLDGATFTLYKKYVEEQKLEDDQETITVKKGTYYPVKTIATGNTFEFSGLDAGDYMLRETKAPDGYNKIEDMYFTITADLDENTDGTAYIKSLSIGNVTDGADNILQNANGEDKKFAFAFGGNTNEETGEKSYDGDISTSIVNMKGVVLPGTGGIGTTIFYVVGGLLIAGAGVVLITKKRMKNAE